MELFSNGFFLYMIYETCLLYKISERSRKKKVKVSWQFRLLLFKNELIVKYCIFVKQIRNLTISTSIFL